jgi:hypothetical protein
MQRLGTLAEQLVGTWMLVSVHNVRNYGSRADLFGPNPKGVVIYTSDGHFALQSRSRGLIKAQSSGCTA